MERSNPAEAVVPPTYDDLVDLLERSNQITSEYRALALRRHEEAAVAENRARIAEERLDHLVLETVSLRTALHRWGKTCPCDCPACRGLIREASRGE